MLENLSKIVVVTGHYGSGKTNLSLNLALALRERGESVTLADLDVVNPYFRSADFRPISEKYGISLIAPAYANSNLDIPALTGALDAKLDGGDYLVIDVGGDDAGAYALGRYAARIVGHGYNMLFVANFFRYLTRTAEESAQMLADIEYASRLKATAIANNSNLAGQTTREDVLASIVKAKELCALTGLPLAFTGVHKKLAGEMSDIPGLLPVGVYVKTLWA